MGSIPNGGTKIDVMSRTRRICPRTYIEVADGKFWRKCKCEWCMNLSKKREEERWQDKQIKDYYRNIA